MPRLRGSRVQFGVKATFVSSTKAPEKVIYEVVKAVFDNFDRFKRLHPAFANLKPKDMVSDGTTAPPQIVRFEASDPTERDLVYSEGDEIEIEFDMATSRAHDEGGL